MENEKRLIDANALVEGLKLHGAVVIGARQDEVRVTIQRIKESPTVDAVEMPDKELLKAIKLLIEQYEHSKRSDYVHNPIAHAFYHTWKQLDERRSDA